jgi:hypothetical protein
MGCGGLKRLATHDRGAQRHGGWLRGRTTARGGRPAVAGRAEVLAGRGRPFDE